MATINFKGKEIVRNYHLTVPYHELKSDAEKSLTKKISLNDNLIIHGDNLLALKALLPTYAGRVKCIYIDPPYNTGNEKWAYNDNVNSPMMKEWLGKVVDKDDLTRHDKWLCMMMPRLRLLRELLSEDGILFASIGDDEVDGLKLLLKEIFGEESFITVIPRLAKTTSNKGELFAPSKDFVLCFAKDISKLGKFYDYIPEKYIKKFKYTDKDGRKFAIVGLYQAALDPMRGCSNQRYLIKCPNGELVIPPGNVFPQLKKDGEKIEPQTHGDKVWRWTAETYKNKKLNLIFRKTGNSPLVNIDGKQARWNVYTKMFLDERMEEGLRPRDWADEFTNDYGTNELKDLGLDRCFDYPKPTRLIQWLIHIAFGNEKNFIVLDSFTGSGTTAHAVLALNKKDGGNRKFILVQLPEVIEKDKAAYKLGFRQIIDITAERVRRVIKGVKSARDENLQKGLGGSFSYFKLGKPIDAERILKGEDLPSFVEMARYIFYTATGEEFNEKKIDQKTGFIGESKGYKVYLLYKPDLEYLKNTALTLDFAKKLGKSAKKKLVFAPTKYLDHEHLERLGVEFAQLPFDIYKKQ